MIAQSQDMKAELEKRGFLVIGAFDTYSDSSIQFYPKPMHTAGHPDEVELKEAENFGRGICSISERTKQGEDDIIPEIKLTTDTWWASASQNLTLDIMRKISPEFKINREKCTQCMICQENCPADAIDIDSVSMRGRSDLK